MKEDIFPEPKPELESRIRRKISLVFQACGYDTIAVEAKTPLGFPDNLYVKNGITVYVEVKRLPDTLAPAYRKDQLPTLTRLRRAGAPAFVGTLYQGNLYLLPPKKRYAPEDFQPHRIIHKAVDPLALG